MVIVSAEEGVGRALSGLPFVHHMARAEAKVGRRMGSLVKLPSQGDTLHLRSKTREDTAYQKIPVSGIA